MSERPDEGTGAGAAALNPTVKTQDNVDQEQNDSENSDQERMEDK